jgi:hypothetical protein
MSPGIELDTSEYNYIALNKVYKFHDVTTTILDSICRLIFYLKHNTSMTGESSTS